MNLPPSCLPPAEPDLADVRDKVAAAWAVSVKSLLAHDMGRRVNDCRGAAALAMRTLCPSRTLEEIGALLDRPRWEVRRIIETARGRAAPTPGSIR